MDAHCGAARHSDLVPHRHRDGPVSQGSTVRNRDGGRLLEGVADRAAGEAIDSDDPRSYACIREGRQCERGGRFGEADVGRGRHDRWYILHAYIEAARPDDAVCVANRDDCGVSRVRTPRERRGGADVGVENGERIGRDHLVLRSPVTEVRVYNKRRGGGRVVDGYLVIDVHALGRYQRVPLECER